MRLLTFSELFFSGLNWSESRTFQPLAWPVIYIWRETPQWLLMIKLMFNKKYYIFQQVTQSRSTLHITELKDIYNHCIRNTHSYEQSVSFSPSRLYLRLLAAERPQRLTVVKGFPPNYTADHVDLIKKGRFQTEDSLTVSCTVTAHLYFYDLGASYRWRAPVFCSSTSSLLTQSDTRLIFILIVEKRWILFLNQLLLKKTFCAFIKIIRPKSRFSLKERVKMKTCEKRDTISL